MRWDVTQRHIESIDAYAHLHKEMPSKKALINAVAAPMQNAVTYSQEENDQGLYYFDSWGRIYVIGETDTSYTNSAATRFYSSFANGFNLTNLEVLLNYASTKEKPVVLEIYFGKDIETATLTYQQELTDTYAGNNFLKLEEQIYIEQGMYFWIVTHIPAGNLYPLGAGIETDKVYSEQCYMSLNWGESWGRFEDLYYNNMLVWAVKAYSAYNTPGEYLRLSPSSGEVSSQDSVLITSQFDASRMINGTYKSNLLIKTNEPGEPMIRVPNYVEVQGQKPVLSSEQLVDFGNTIYGTEKLIPITIKNIGYGNFKYPNIQTSNPEFEMVGYVSTINPLSEVTFKMKYKPTKTGNSNAVVTLSNYLGDEYSFNVFGMCAEPPLMELSHVADTFNTLSIGDTVSGGFYIKNSGNYPLNYNFPAFSNTDSDIGSDVHKFGYSWKQNEMGALSTPEFVWNDISATGTKITDYDRTRDFWYYPVELGFDFPFFGKNENMLNITNYGLVSFDQNSVFNVFPMSYKMPENPDRYISAMGVPFDVSLGGAVYYQDLGDMFIVQYDRVIYEVFDWWSGTSIQYEITFQIVLHDNGTINYYYNDLAGIDPYDIATAGVIAIEDQNEKDGILVSDSDDQYAFISSNSAIEFTSPGLGLVYELSNPEGSIQIGDSVRIDYKAATDILNVGTHVERLPILTNDTINNPGIFSLIMNVTDGGYPELQIANENFSFGYVFQNDTEIYKNWLVNTGRANDTIVSAVLDNDYFKVSDISDVVITPNRKIMLDISPVSTSLGTYSDVLTITAKSGKTLQVDLSAEIIEAPEMDISISSVDETIAAGAVQSVEFTVTNNGANNLELAPVNGNWTYVREKLQKKAVEIPEYTYNLAHSATDESVLYSWQEIKDSGIKLDALTDPNLEVPEFWSQAIELPFDFEFYGEIYDTLYVGYSGLLTLIDPGETYYYFGPGATYPNAMEPNAVIAPMWGFVAPLALGDEYGVFYKIEQDHIVIEWYNYIDGFGMGSPGAFQAILNANGTIKFQYNFMGQSYQRLTSFSSTGIENADGSDGITVSFYQEGLINDQTAITLSPVKKYTLAPEETKTFELFLDASELFAGDYTYDMVFLNNDPLKKGLSLPVHLAVTGEASLVFENTVDYGIVQVVEDRNAEPWESPYIEYTAEFEIKNEGYARTEILSIDPSKVVTTNVEAYVLGTDFFGNPSWQWVSIYDLPLMDWETWSPIPIYIGPQSSMKFRALYAPQTSESLRDTLILQTDNLEHTNIEIAIIGETQLPPSIHLSDKEINVYAESDAAQEQFSYYFDNKEGASNLDFDLELIIKRTIDKTSSQKKSVANSSDKVIDLSGKAVPAGTKMSEADDDFNRILQYDDASSAEKTVGYGGQAMFATATRFSAPADGFNLTHVRSYYIPGDWLESEIVVEVYAGDPMIGNASVIYSEEFVYTIDEPTNSGDFITFELAENQLFYPKEDFFVVFKYPTGVKYPQGLATVEEELTNRFMYGDGTQWFDIIGSGYEQYGWMVRAIEAEPESNAWVEISSELQGSVESGDSVAVDLSFYGSRAEKGVNKAILYINSNDPYQERKVVNVNFRLNDGPEFDLGKRIEYFINEGDSIYLEVLAKDIEGDAFTLEMKESYQGVTTEMINAETIGVSYKSDYFSAGIHDFVVLGTDTRGNAKEFTIIVNVINVNRAPQVGDNTLIELVLEDGLVMIPAADIVVDADNEELDYSVETVDRTIVETFVSEENFIFSPKALGTTTVNVEAKDHEGEKVKVAVSVTVIEGTGVNAFSFESFSVYPNPTSGSVNLYLPETITGKFSIEILDATGKNVKQIQMAGSGNSTLVLDIESYPQGIYFVRIVNGNRFYQQKLIKE